MSKRKTKNIVSETTKQIYVTHNNDSTIEKIKTNLDSLTEGEFLNTYRLLKTYKERSDALIKRGYEIAKKAGCGYTYILASSIYSQKIFHKLGNCKVLHEVEYEDYKYDKRGRPFLVDPREHKVIQVLAINHSL